MGEAAPYRADLAECDAGRAIWAVAEDDRRLRIGLFPCEGAKGTVLIFPGRTEYIEKYGRVCNDLLAANYAVASIDWRGQGMSDRVADDPQLGHVVRFPDYQLDVAAFVAALRSEGMPEPFFLIAHSMGGCIGLRALIEGLEIRRAVFSAPMWGIFVSARLKPVALVLPPLARRLGQGLRYTPGTRPTAYVAETEFTENLLTTDPDHYAYLARQAAGDKSFALGGPSLQWFDEAVREGAALAMMQRPKVPCRTYLGTEEGIVSAQAISAIHKGWDEGELVMVNGAKHELMMEAPEMRQRFMEGTLEFFDAA